MRTFSFPSDVRAMNRRGFVGAIGLGALGSPLLLWAQSTNSGSRRPQPNAPSLDPIAAVLIQELPRIAGDKSDNLGELDVAVRFFAAYLQQHLDARVPQEMRQHVERHGHAGFIQHARKHHREWAAQNLSPEFRILYNQASAQLSDELFAQQLDRLLAEGPSATYVQLADAVRARKRSRRGPKPVMFVQDDPCAGYSAAASAAGISAVLICTCCGIFACIAATAIYLAAVQKEVDCHNGSSGGGSGDGGLCGDHGCPTYSPPPV